VHKAYEEELGDKQLAARSSFLFEFLPAHLNTIVEEEIDPHLYESARGMVLEYEELVAEATRLSDVEEHDAECSYCGETIALSIEGGGKCIACGETEEFEQCSRCGGYRPKGSFDGLAVCPDCFEDVVSRSD